MVGELPVSADGTASTLTACRVEVIDGYVEPAPSRRYGNVAFCIVYSLRALDPLPMTEVAFFIVYQIALAEHAV